MRPAPSNGINKSQEGQRMEEKEEEAKKKSWQGPIWRFILEKKRKEEEEEDISRQKKEKEILNVRRICCCLEAHLTRVSDPFHAA